MSVYSRYQEALDPRVVIPFTSAVVYYVYKQYEPSSPRSAALLLVVLPSVLVALLREHYTSIIGATFAVFTAYWFLIAGFTIAYRLSPFHPLARYPGPVLCKVSKLWLAYVTATEFKAHLYVQQLHQQYGPVVRIGPNEVSINHKEVSSEILSGKGLPRGPYYDTRQHDAGRSLDGMRDMTLHTARRRPWARGMSTAAMKYYEMLIRNTVYDLVNGLKQRAGQTVDISEWMTYFGFDFMGHMAFTNDCGLLRTGSDVDGLLELIQNANTNSAWLSQIPWAVPFLMYVPGASEKWDQMKVVGEKAVEDRINLGSTHPDLFHYLMDEDGLEPVKPTKELVAVDGQLAIIAGGDTAAIALSHLWYFLLRNPSCLDRLRKEVDEAFPPGEDSTLDFVKQSVMPYLNACINETMRLYPPVLAGLQRRVESGTGGKMVGDHFLPEQTQISVWAYTIHRDPEHFSPLPDVFWPDRWLPQNEYKLPSGHVIPADQVITDRDLFIPFSTGPMVCVGKNVAMTEMRAVMCALVQQFDVKMADRTYVDTWEDKIKETFTTGRGSLPVYISLRK